MRKNLKLLPYLAAGLGLVGMGLRKWLYLTAPDEKNLLPLWHPLTLALWLLTAALAVTVLLAVRKEENIRGYHRNFHNAVPAAIGCFALALGLGGTAFLGDGGTVEMVVGLAGAASMVFVGVSRLQGKRPNYIFHALVCIFFAVYLVNCYRDSRGNPQLTDYAFIMFAIVGLMLFAYQQTAFDGGYGKRKSQLAWGLLSAYFCLVSLSDAENLLLCGCGALWCLTNLSSLTPEPRRGEWEVG